MKYRKEQVIEDKNILPKIPVRGKSDYTIARLMNCSPSYINHLRHEKRIASEEFYNKLIRVLTK
jgi:hypothetical protein